LALLPAKKQVLNVKFFNSYKQSVGNRIKLHKSTSLKLDAILHRPVNLSIFFSLKKKNPLKKVAESFS